MLRKKRSFAHFEPPAPFPVENPFSAQ